MKKDRGAIPLSNLLILAGLLILTIIVAIPVYMRAQIERHQETCQQQLSLIDGAKLQYGLENDFYEEGKDDAVPEWDDLVGLTPFLKEIPTCPSGGKYTIGPLDKLPSCSLSDKDYHPHEFPQPGFE